MELSGYDFDVVREPLRRPFSFKGGAFTEKWLTRTTLRSASGVAATEIGGLAVLWSDPEIFAEHSETGGNVLMCAIAERAALLACEAARGSGRSLGPEEIIPEILPEVHRYAAEVSQHPTVRKTFTLNAMVSLDLALWKLAAAERQVGSFDELLPDRYGAALSHRHQTIAHIPLISYRIPVEEIRTLAESGTFIFKIKIGQAGTQSEMLEQDCRRIEEIHRELGSIETDAVPGGHILYYLDANGRYQSIETLERLLDRAESLGMLDRIVILEEPFPETLDADVSNLPVRVAADESLEDIETLETRIQQGYGAAALKPAGKTLSLTLEMARVAEQHDLPCFVADSACLPVLVDWNKNVAARIAPFPDLGMSAMESNGADHYLRWDELCSTHPCPEGRWIHPRNGVFELDEEFYRQSGGILSP